MNGAEDLATTPQLCLSIEPYALRFVFRITVFHVVPLFAQFRQGRRFLGLE